MGKFNVEVTDEQLLEWYLENGKNASALADRLGCDSSKARVRVQKMLQRMEQHAILEKYDPTLVNSIAALFKKQNIDPNAVKRFRDIKVSAHTMGIKNKDGQFEEHGLTSTSFRIDPLLNLEDNPCITQAAPISVLYTPSDAPRILRKTSVTAAISDTHYGILRGPNGVETIHDEAAIDVAKQIVYAVQPKRLVHIGDGTDLAQFSVKYPQRREYTNCAQESINITSSEMAEFKSCAGPQCEEFIFVGGNHDLRIQTYVDFLAKEVSGLRRANTLPSEWPVNSLPFLCRFDEIGIRYSGNDPGGLVWLYDNLAFIHRPPKKLELRGSVIHGHTHHQTQVPSVQHHSGGRDDFFINDIGCLCKVGTRGDIQSLVISETPSDRGRTDWSQGMGVIYTVEGKSPIHQIDLIHIQNGRAMHGGELFESRTLKGEVE